MLPHALSSAKREQLFTIPQIYNNHIYIFIYEVHILVSPLAFSTLNKSYFQNCTVF